jgi:hypothetical protein
MPKKPTTPPDTKDNSPAGKIASPASVTPEPPLRAKTTKKGKLPKKDKRRLPRRQKKAQQRAQASQKG